MWAPYDETTYGAVLAAVSLADTILEIGAGDLRLARRLARKTNQVFAWEIQTEVLRQGLVEPLPANLTAVCCDARQEPIPPGITAAVILMRHCRRFRYYVDKLRTAGCRWLITNSRWGISVEKIDLTADRMLFSAVSLGWFACWCGNTGFVPGSPEKLTAEIEGVIHEVYDCPNCSK